MSKQAYKRVRKHLKMEVCRKPLDNYGWPGGYPLFYIYSDGGCLCPKCVNDEIENIDESIKSNSRDGWKVEAVDVNWEDASLYCDHCSQRIESAYAEDEVATQSGDDE